MPAMNKSNLDFLDLLVSGFDQVLRTASGLQPGSGRSNPGIRDRRRLLSPGNNDGMWPD